MDPEPLLLNTLVCISKGQKYCHIGRAGIDHEIHLMKERNLSLLRGFEMLLPQHDGTTFLCKIN